MGEEEEENDAQTNLRRCSALGLPSNLTDRLAQGQTTLEPQDVNLLKNLLKHEVTDEASQPGYKQCSLFEECIDRRNGLLEKYLKDLIFETLKENKFCKDVST